MLRATSTHGGESFLADGGAVYHQLATQAPDAVEALRDNESAWFGMNPAYCGPVFDAAQDGRVTVRLRLDELARFGPGADALPQLREAVESCTVAFRLAAGEGYLIDNRRMLHGRRAFTGSRVMHRIVGNPLPHLAFQPGFDPAQAGAGAAHEFAPPPAPAPPASILDCHQPAGPLLDWSWRTLPRLNEHRRCLACGERWPCAAAQAARDIEESQLAGWR